MNRAGASWGDSPPPPLHSSRPGVPGDGGAVFTTPHDTQAWKSGTEQFSPNPISPFQDPDPTPRFPAPAWLTTSARSEPWALPWSQAKRCNSGPCRDAATGCRLPPGRRLQARLHPRPLARDCQQIPRCITAELAPRLHPGPSGPRPRPRAAPIGRGTRVIKSHTKAYAPPPRPGGCQEPSANYSHKNAQGMQGPFLAAGAPPPASSDAPGNGQLRPPFSSSAPP